MITYSAPYARMRALKGNLLDKNQYEELLQAADVQTALAALNRTAYEESLRNAVELPEIEHALKQDIVVCYRKILAFLGGKPARLIQALLGRFELHNVKSIIRAFAHTSNSGEIATPFLFALGRYHTIPIEKLLSANNLEECIELLKKTPFSRPIEIGYQQYITEKRLFSLEIALDLDYYGRLWDSFESLAAMDKGEAGRLLGIQYDILNLIWILRFREYYKLTPEQIFQYILPHGFSVRGDIFWKIMSGSDVVGSIIEQKVRPYDHILGGLNQNGSDSAYEIILSRYLREQSIKALFGFPLQASSFIAFFILKETEIRDIISIISGKSLELPQERIRANLVTL